MILQNIRYVSICSKNFVIFHHLLHACLQIYSDIHYNWAKKNKFPPKQCFNDSFKNIQLLLFNMINPNFNKKNAQSYQFDRCEPEDLNSLGTRCRIIVKVNRGCEGNFSWRLYKKKMPKFVPVIMAFKLLIFPWLKNRCIVLWATYIVS